MNLKLDCDERFIVSDADSTILMWALPDLPDVYRQLVTLPKKADESKVKVALVPKGYTRDIKHITEGPHFGPHVLDVYTLKDESKLYVGV